MAEKDYYKTLGVSKTASADEIKKAFRKLALENHPDRHKGDLKAEQKFKEINEAYDTLKDSKKRAQYDRFGSGGPFQGGGNPFHGGNPFEGGGNPFQGNGGFEQFSDIFGEFFKAATGTSRQTQSMRGSDLRYDLSVTLEEAFKGAKKSIKYRALTKCDTCDGSGSASKSAPVDCATCNGTGRVRGQQGFFIVEHSCHTCSGTGKTVKDPCKTCMGQGAVAKERSLVVTIPPGIDDDSRIKLQSEGEAGFRGAESGDLYIFTSVKKHDFFARNGADLYCKVPIKVSTAALGGTLEVPTIDGHIEKMQIESGVQHGKKVKLKGFGMPIIHSKNRGDMYVELEVEVPVKLSKRQRELLEEFEQGSKADSHPKCHSFFTKLKDIWRNFTKE